MIDIGTKVTIWIPGKRLVAVSQILELLSLTRDFCSVLDRAPQIHISRPSPSVFHNVILFGNRITCNVNR